MNMFKKILCVFIITLILEHLIISSGASNFYGFKTIPLSSEEIELIWDNLDVKVLNLDFGRETNKAIVSFDVSRDERILLALENNRVCILDNNKILNCFSFNDNGSYYVKWNGDNYLLFLVRSSLIIELTPDLQLINIFLTDTDDVNTSKLWRNINQKEISINDNKYILRNQMGPLNIISVSYSQLIKIDNMKNELILYNVNTERSIKMYVFLIFIIIFFVAVFCVIFCKTRRQDKTGDGSVSRS